MDWVLQERGVTGAIANEYLSAIVSHTSYWGSEDFAGFVMSMTGFVQPPPEISDAESPPPEEAETSQASTQDAGDEGGAGQTAPPPGSEAVP